MFRRFFKLLLALLVLVVIAVIGLVVMITTVEDPLSFTIRSQQAAAPSGSGGQAITLECEVKNTSPFPMEFLPATFTLLPAENIRAAFLPSSDVASTTEVRLNPGEAWNGKLHGSQPLNPADIHTFSYDWNMWGQDRFRTGHRWLVQNAGFIPDSWLAGLYWHTEPRKGRVKNVPMPEGGNAPAASSGKPMAP